jgi:hypothetical protein
MTITLKAIHLVSEGSYLVQTGGHKLEVDGIPFTGHQFVVTDPNQVIRVRGIPPRILSYVNGEGKEKTVSDYDSEKKDLLKGAEDMGFGEYEFLDLDSEFAFRKFSKEWTPKYSEPRVEKDPVELEITEVRTESGDPHIKSLWNAPHVTPNKALYSLDRNHLALLTIQEACENYNVKLDIPNHSGARFSQVNGKYLFSETLNFPNPSFVGTLQQCKEEKERIVNHIYTEIEVLLAKSKKVALNDVGRVHDELKAIYALMLNVWATQKTSYSLSACRVKTKALLDDLTKELLG